MCFFAHLFLAHLPVRPLDAHVDVQEAPLGHLEHEAQLGAHLDLVEETLLGVSVNLEEKEMYLR